MNAQGTPRAAVRLLAVNSDYSSNYRVWGRSIGRALRWVG